METLNPSTQHLKPILYRELIEERKRIDRIHRKVNIKLSNKYKKMKVVNWQFSEQYLLKSQNFKDLTIDGELHTKLRIIEYIHDIGKYLQ